MKYLKHFEEYNLNENDGILIVCDVQDEFKSFFQNEFPAKLNEYCKNFHTVYQIWDSNKATAPTWTFANQKGAYEKKYGTTSKDILDIDGDDRTGPITDIVERLNKKYPNAKEGQMFKLKNRESYVIRVKNNHHWFYVPEKLTELFKSLKGKKVVLVGGSSMECIKDVYEAMESFGVFPIYDKRYMYSAKTSNAQPFDPKTQPNKL